MSFPRLRFAVLVGSSCAALAFACGGISDPTRNGGERVATVSGALTGTSVPANARVALVWRKVVSNPADGAYAVGDDVPVVGGKFTMSLAVPPAGYFSNIDGASSNFGSSSSGGEPPKVGTAEPAPAPDPGPSGGSTSGGGKMPSFGSRLSPRDTVSGGITSPLSGAVAGFVVYVDTNANGKLDLAGTYAASTDQILGGNKELVLAYLRDGGALDYEKLRDTSGILPAQGFNLAWTVGKRWMPLNVVELKLDPKQGLPGPVCSSGSSSSGSDGFDPVATPLPPPEPRDIDGGAAPGSSSSSSGSSPAAPYPSPSDPNLHCAPDGRSFTYSAPSNCGPTPPAPVGLCATNDGDSTEECSGGVGWGTAIPSGSTPPLGWPCTVDGGGSSSGSSGATDAGASD